ncbi:phage tail sheath family protein [uncultured Nostoc sp.]|uniref:phage tail sheath family protein n=1 Tax=uncultured Nostoc sp. TaxID=340711 RepID=UPI0035CA6B92
MPVTPSYPGIYIQELPSSTHTITAAPTSIAVFIGYTHPFLTLNPGKAIEIFSFTDYEREFGGFFTSNAFDSGTSKALFGSVANAVNQFFLNGGSDAYVIGLTPKYNDPTKPGSQPIEIEAATHTIGGIVFKALQPTDTVDLTVTIVPNASNAAIADITIFYGSQIETYRGVTVTFNQADNRNFIENRIGTATNHISSLVTVTPSVTQQQGQPSHNDYGTAFTPATSAPLTYPPNANPTNNANWTVFNSADFTLGTPTAPAIFDQDSELDKLPIFNLLVLPGIVNPFILSEALAFCERKQAFLIMDPPFADIADGQLKNSIYYDKVNPNSENPIPQSTNGALYFPYIKSTDPITGKATDSVTGQAFILPPSGTVAGIYARTDLNRGVWKAPAGLETTILNTTGVVDGTGTLPDGRLTNSQQGVLNLVGINCLRTFPGVGTVVYGARTLVGYDQPTETPFQQWKYVPVRRMALFIEQTLLQNLGWVVFEPNDEPLWAAIRLSIGNFMLSLFKQGALQGSTPSQAFQVKCDSSTTTSDDQNRGIVNIIVAFAPLKPAEFVIVNIAQLAGQVQS